MENLPLGKVPWPLLSKIVHKTGFKDNKGIVQTAEEGVDVAVLNLADIISNVKKTYNTNSIPYLIYKSDPITFPTPNPAKYLIIVNKNDLATAGALPFGITSTIVLPPNSKSQYLLNLQSQLSEVCNDHKITILGGHTEVSENVKFPILSASMIGFVPPEYYIPRNPEEGDLIICSGWVGAEGTGILLVEGKEYFYDILGQEEYNLGAKIGEDIDISERIINCNKEWHNSLNLVHDATEGGILGAIYECLPPKGFGCEVYSSDIPIADVTKKISEELQINPFMLISSGAVLVICKRENAKYVMECLYRENKPAAIIGKILRRGNSVKMDGKPIGPPEADHLIKGLEQLKVLTKGN